MERDDLVRLVSKIMAVEGTDEELQRWVAEFERAVPHPEASDSIFYDGLSPEEVVEKALAYRPIQLP